MASSRLQARLTSVTTTYKQTIPLIHRLQNFTSAVGQGDEARLELSAEIHHRLKEMEAEMELLRVEIEPLESTGYWRRESETKETQREEILAVMRKLDEDLKAARSQFRKAQLQAKRNAEAARRKERQLLFSGITEEDVARRRASPKLTHDDLVVNASNDVTAALRRTHQLMQSELSRSRFAQETLEQSTAALSSLSESYSNLDTLLASSRSLVSSLLRSQKSDTWYLETAFYILIGTIIWLLFRRVFYGPLWWFLWLPLKMTYRATFALLGAVGLASGVSQTTAVESVVTPGTTATIPYVISDTFSLGPEITASSDAPSVKESLNPTATILDEIEEITSQMPNDQPQVPEDEETNVDDISPEERLRQESEPRNPKKRMWEEKIDNVKRDEL
ncbi:hypothetical protein VTO42DRAFT_3446 [Malbranchea cinnamomea]